jgi:hypothetical protein
MDVTATHKAAPPPEVREFLQRQGAEAEFRTVYALAKECFPELRAINVELQEDPDEADRLRVVLWVLLPQLHPHDLLQAQVRDYHARFVATLPLSRCPLFVLLNDFVRE